MLITKELYESPMKERNEERFPIDHTSCVCCNKPTKEEFYVHMTTDWVAVESHIQEEDLKKYNKQSQGLFPIGSSCAKKMGKNFIIHA